MDAGRYPEDGPEGANAKQRAAAQNATRVLLNQFGILRAHRHFKNSGPVHIAADADKLHPGRSVFTLRLEPVHSAHQNHRGKSKRFHVIDRGGLVPQTIRSWEGRLVPRLSPLAFDGFEQRALLAADVAAGADEDFQIKTEIAAQNACAQQLFAVAALDFFLQNFFWIFVLVADIQNPAARAGDQAGRDHAFNHQPGCVLHDEAVLDGAGFALVGIADNVFLLSGCVVHNLPLAARGKAGPAHATQAAGFQRGHNAGPVAGFHKFPHDRIIRRALIGIGNHRRPAAIARRLRKGAA